MAINVPVKFLFKVSSNIVSGNDSAKKGTQLSLVEEGYINKESEKQLRSRYETGRKQNMKKHAISNVDKKRNTSDLIRHDKNVK